MTPKPVVEYSEVTDQNRSIPTMLKQVEYQGRTYSLIHRTSGYEPAGSMARWTNEIWSVTALYDGTPHGRRFKTEAEARDLFDRWISYEQVLEVAP